MRGGQHHSNQAHKALTEIGVAATPGSYSATTGGAALDKMYRPAKHVGWHRERGWTLEFDGREWGDWIAIGPPDMTPGKAARACARLLTEQNRRQRKAIETAVRTTLSADTLGEVLDWQAIADLRAPILDAVRADVLAEQDGSGNDDA